MSYSTGTLGAPYVEKDAYATASASQVAPASRLQGIRNRLDDARQFSDELAGRLEALADHLLGGVPQPANQASSANAPICCVLDDVEETRNSLAARLHRIHDALKRLENDLG